VGRARHDHARTTGEVREAIEDTLDALDSGTLRVAERGRTAPGT
jgi:hypothetical protein